jgi:hypothetical protein
MQEALFIWHWRRLVSTPPLWIALIAGMLVLNVTKFFGGMFPAMIGASFVVALLLGFAAPGLSPVASECRYLLARPVSRQACLVTWAMVALLAIALAWLGATLIPWGRGTVPNMTLVQDANTRELLKAAKFERMELPSDWSPDQVQSLRKQGAEIFALPGYFAFQRWLIASGIVLGIVVRLGAPGRRGAAGSSERFAQAFALFGPALLLAGAWIGLVAVGHATYFTVWSYLHASRTYLVLGASVLIAGAACARAWSVADVS